MPDKSNIDATAPERLATFNQYRGLLFAVAYRTLGSVADAEDMLQETFIRWQQAYWPIVRHQGGDEEEKFDALEHYGTHPSSTDAERAALDYATELTRNRTVNQAAFDRMLRYYSEREAATTVSGLPR